MNTKQLKDKILAMAMRGELVEQEPTDESAEILLEKIKEEKAKLIVLKKIKKEKALAEIEEDEIPYDLPQGWVWTRLGEIGNWTSGATPKKSELSYYENGTIPWIKTGDLRDDFITNAVEKITELALEKTSVKLFEKDTVLIAMYGATIGRVGITTYPATTNQACCGLMPHKKEYIETMYIFYYLMNMKKYFLEIGYGAAQPNISKEKIVATLLPLPPLAEQKRVVEKIETLFAEVDKLEESRENLDGLKGKLDKKLLDMAMRGELVEQDPTDESAEILLEKIKEEKAKLIAEKKIKKEKPLAPIEEDEIPYELPQGWVWARLGEVVDSRIGKTPDRKNLDYWGSGYSWISIADMNNNEYISETKEQITELAYNDVFKNNISKKGTLIMSFKLTIGKTAILKKDAFHNEAITSLVPYLEDSIDKNYLKAILPHFSNLTEQTNAIMGKTLNKEKIRNIKIPLPPFEEQKRIAERLETIRFLFYNIYKRL